MRDTNSADFTRHWYCSESAGIGGVSKSQPVQETLPSFVNVWRE